MRLDHHNKDMLPLISTHSTIPVAAKLDKLVCDLLFDLVGSPQHETSELASHLISICVG